jgi:hypothetical protein
MSEENEKIIKLVQSSTRNILSHYRERAELLTECSDDIKLLIREGHDPEIAHNTAERLFGSVDNVLFLAILDLQISFLIYLIVPFAAVEACLEACRCFQPFG